ncbi:methyltransferase domain-containing protein [Candidatus Bathyarchaeota archaeon]|nr:methyltransferase domain-containing protein [Candidatus Bathyarchaeota archaeon]
MSRHKRTIRDRYDDLGGKIYDLRYTEEQMLKYRAVIDELGEADGVVLDNGCGTGLLLETMEVVTVGLDLSTQLLVKAHERTKTLHMIHLVNGDSENLPFRSIMFSAVYSVTVIQNSMSPVRMLEEMGRVKRGAGVMAVTTLKKAFSKQEFIELIIKSNLKIKRFVDSENTNDWMIIAE